MSRAALLLVLPLVFGCAKKDEAPVADTSTAVAAEPVAAAPSIVGKWAVNVMPEGKDTTVASYVLDAKEDQSAWTLTFPGMDPLPVRVISVTADSVVTEVGPFPSQVRKGETVNMVHSNFVLNGDNITGKSIVHYARKTADSVSTLRQTGTRQ
jgi:hypothetical protein